MNPAHRKQQLLLESERLRGQIHQQVQTLQPLYQTATRVQQAGQRIKHKPWLVLGVVAATIIMWPKRSLQISQKLWAARRFITILSRLL